MAVGNNLPVELIEQLSGDVKRAASSLEGQLSSLRSQCQRDPTFTGNAAQRYDEYMIKWDSSQRNLLEALNGAGDLLAQFAVHLREIDTRTAAAFSL